MESSSESTSRETTPESDESEDEDDNGEDEDEEVAEQDDENPLMTDESIGNVPGKPIVQRGIAELGEQYSQYFAEYANPNVSQCVFSNNTKPPTIDIDLIFYHLKILESHSNQSTKVGDVSDTEHYENFAQQTHGLIKFAKIAYPDLVGGTSPEMVEERLLEKNKQACR